VCVNDPEVVVKSPSKLTEVSAGENSFSQETRLRLQKALSQLASLERECVLMFAEGHSYKEIALHHNLTYGVTVDVIRRSIRKLRK
jgi:DNA-binding CsgD family transcriptional regulator